MINKIPFYKMHGLGNDFVIVDANILPDDFDLVTMSKKMADRRIGIGCDQLIIYKILEIEDENVFDNSQEIEVRIYNPDGTVAKACGNAFRCLSRMLSEIHGFNEISIKVDGRLFVSYYLGDGISEVNMGIANFEAPWMIENQAIWKIAEKYSCSPKEVICVDVGNPHLVIFSRLQDQDKALIGANMQKIFAEGINVNFAEVEKHSINLQVWERGVGFTLACGSGACATFAAASKLGFVSDETDIKFSLGSLHMKFTLDSDSREILIRGTSEHVFHGDFVYE